MYSTLRRGNCLITSGLKCPRPLSSRACIDSARILSLMDMAAKTTAFVASDGGLLRLHLIQAQRMLAIMRRKDDTPAATVAMRKTFDRCCGGGFEEVKSVSMETRRSLTKNSLN